MFLAKFTVLLSKVDFTDSLFLENTTKNYGNITITTKYY